MTATVQTGEGPVEPGQIERERRAAIITASVVGVVGCVGVAVPMVWSLWPSEREKAAGGPVEVDISSIDPGQMKIVEWRGKPVWILHRTPEMLASLKQDQDLLNDPGSKRTAFPTPEWALKDPATRSIKPEWFVAVGICTHLGCSPNGPFPANENPQLGAIPGFVCPCHGSAFDVSGRVFKNRPASDNLEVPAYQFLSDTRLLIGEHKNST